jgi:hypothetical protein
MILESVITCPHCATEKSETMPTNACQFFYMCTGRLLRILFVWLGFHARRSRPSVQVRRAPLPAVADSHHGEQYRPKHT